MVHIQLRSVLRLQLSNEFILLANFPQVDHIVLDISPFIFIQQNNFLGSFNSLKFYFTFILYFSAVIGQTSHMALFLFPGWINLPGHLELRFEYVDRNLAFYKYLYVLFENLLFVGTSITIFEESEHKG